MRPAASPPRVLLAGDADDLVAPLQAAGLALTRFDPAGDWPPAAGHAAAVLDAGSDPAATAARVPRLRPTPADAPLPFLWVQDSGPLGPAFAAGADAALARPLDPDALVGQVRALVRQGQTLARLTGRAVEALQLNQRLQQAYQQTDRDLELARRIQRSLTPRALPEVAAARFAVSHRPRSRVGGDFYDVARLDEDHVAFYLADALAGGAPASGLLTIYLKKTIQPKEIVGRAYRLVPPGEVLHRLHRELAALGLTDQPALTIVYGLLNCRDGQLTYARAAHPAPVYVPQRGPVEAWSGTGPLLGVLEGEYPTQARALRPGDKLLLHTDGLSPADDGPALGALVASAAEEHRNEPVGAFVERVTRDLLARARQPDDFTVLALEYGG
jgi:sigma-B regulation protein RsbU (phosphoserine phosphatase)